MSAALPQSLFNRFQIPGAKILAVLAYTFYLTHKAVIHLFRPLLETHEVFENSTILMVTVFVLCLLGANILHLGIEKPFLSVRDQILVQSKKPDCPGSKP